MSKNIISAILASSLIASFGILMGSCATLRSNESHNNYTDNPTEEGSNEQKHEAKKQMPLPIVDKNNNNIDDRTEEMFVELSKKPELVSEIERVSQKRPADYDNGDLFIVREILENPEKEAFLMNYGYDVKQAIQRVFYYSPDLQTIILFYKVKEPVKFLDKLGSILKFKKNDYAKLEKSNISYVAANIGEQGGIELLDYLTNVLELESITGSFCLQLLSGLSNNNGLEVMKVLHEKYGVNRISCDELLPISNIARNLGGAEGLIKIKDAFKIPDLSRSQISSLSKLRREDVEALMSNGVEAFNYASENLGMNGLSMDELAAFAAFAKDRKGVDVLRNPRTKEIYETFKAAFGVKKSNGLAIPIYAGFSVNIHTLETLVVYGGSSESGYKYLKEQIKKAEEVHKKANELGLWGDLTFSEANTLLVTVVSLLEEHSLLLNFLNRLYKETPIRHTTPSELAYYTDFSDKLFRDAEPFFRFVSSITWEDASFGDCMQLYKMQAEGDKRGYLTLYNNYGISNLDRYPEELLAKQSQTPLDEILNTARTISQTQQETSVSTDALASVSTNGSALLVYNKNDWNYSFGNDEHKQFVKDISSLYDTLVFETRTDNGLFKAIKTIGSKRKIKLLDFAGHGSMATLNYGFDEHMDGIDTKMGISSESDGNYYDLTDMDEMAALGPYIAEDAIIVLDSCSTGSGRGKEENLANATAKALPGRTIYSATRPVKYFKLIINENKVTAVVAEGDPTITYAVRYDGEKLVEISIP